MNSLVVDARLIAQSGIGVYLRNLLSQMTETPFEITLLIAKKDREKYPFLKAFSFIEEEAPIYSLKEQWNLQRKIPTCSIFWTPHFNVPLLPVKAKYRVTTIHDLYHIDHGESLSFLERTYAKTLYRAAVNKSDHLMTVSEFTKKRLLHHFPKASSKTTAIPLGAGNSHIAACEKESSLLQAPYFLFVGNVKPHKNLPFLLKAFQEFIAHEETPYNLLIVGKTEGMRSTFDIGAYLMDRPHLLRRVHILGEVSDKELAKIYSKAQAFVFPSIYEGWGLPPLEAMRFGCPVIASNAASIPEACGEGALYFDPHNLDQLVAHLSVLAHHHTFRENLIAKGKAAVENHSWHQCANKHLETFLQLISPERK